MSTNITITSDDVSKSEVIGDIITKALTENGFASVNPTFTVGFMQTDPILEKIGLLDNDEKSALQVIQNAYPNFLNETVNVRAIKVEGLDVNGYDEADEENAFQSRESADRTRYGSEYQTAIFIREDRPGKKSGKQLREESAQLRREAMHLISQAMEEGKD